MNNYQGKRRNLDRTQATGTGGRVT